MKTNIINLFSLFILASLFTACSDDDKADTVKPVVRLIAPAEGDILQIGKDIHFEMEVSDDVMLGSYKVEIHNNFDHHGAHKSKAEADSIPFAFNKSWDVSGKKNTHVHHDEITIPANAKTGDYHFMVYCTDAAGNEANVIALNVVLSSEGKSGEDHHHE